MTQEEMWKTISENDASYDGIFSMQSNLLDGIYCRQSYKSKIPMR